MLWRTISQVKDNLIIYLNDGGELSQNGDGSLFLFQEESC